MFLNVPDLQRCLDRESMSAFTLSCYKPALVGTDFAKEKQYVLYKLKFFQHKLDFETWRLFRRAFFVFNK